jgi:hypothetical protein
MPPAGGIFNKIYWRAGRAFLAAKQHKQKQSKNVKRGAVASERRRAT